jgi:hypothetical protein
MKRTLRACRGTRTDARKTDHVPAPAAPAGPDRRSHGAYRSRLPPARCAHQEEAQSSTKHAHDPPQGMHVHVLVDPQTAAIRQRDFNRVRVTPFSDSLVASLLSGNRLGRTGRNANRCEACRRRALAGANKTTSLGRPRCEPRRPLPEPQARASQRRSAASPRCSTAAVARVR